MKPLAGRARVLLTAFGATLVAAAVIGVGPAAQPSGAESYQAISGAGSTWSANALNQWISDVDQYGMRINYAPTGSSDGRHQFLQGTVDFSASDIPFQSHPEDNSDPEIPRNGSYAYMPITSGGTVFMYNLTINGQQVTSLRLSGQNIAKIFTGVVTKWNDPAIVADNPLLTLPNEAIVPVVRSDGSGSTAQFTTWMISQQHDLWMNYCQKVGRAPKCGLTSYYPSSGNMVAQSGDLGVAGYVAQSYAEGAIGYVNYSYALNAHFPVAKMLNAAGYYTEPTPQAVAVSLLKAEVDTTDTDPSLYLTQKLDGVYADTDARTYELSSYSYLILPTDLSNPSFTKDKGKTLAAFSYYAMCQGQQGSADIGYSPMPMNLVQASIDQIKKIPGAVQQNIDITQCNNPTFTPSGENKLAETAPQPPACDQQGSTQCLSGTGGAASQTEQSAGTPSAGGDGGGSGSGSATDGSSANQTAAGGHSVSSASSRTSTGSNTTGPAGSTAADTPTANTPAAAADPSLGDSSAADPSLGSASADPSSDATGTSNAVGSSASKTASRRSGSTSASQLASARTSTLPLAKGWTGTQTLMLIAGLLVIALVVAPGVTVHYLDSRDRT